MEKTMSKTMSKSSRAGASAFPSALSRGMSPTAAAGTPAGMGLGSLSLLPRSFAELMDDLRAAHDSEVLDLKSEIVRLKESMGKAAGPVNPALAIHQETARDEEAEEDIVEENAMRDIYQSPNGLRGLRARPHFKDEDSVHGDTDDEGDEIRQSGASGEHSVAFALGDDEEEVDVEEVVMDPDETVRYNLRKEWWQSPIDIHSSRPEDAVLKANSLAVNVNVKEMKETIAGDQSHRSQDVQNPRKYSRSATAMSNLGAIDPGATAGKCLMKPGEGRLRISWDIAGMALIAYDIVAIPLQIAFNPDDHPITLFMGWLTLIFWTTDMAMSIRTAYFDNGEIVTDQYKIILNYLKCWFWVDCIVVVPDWTMKILGNSENLASMGRVLRAARAVRVLRLLRLLKLRRMLEIVYDRIDSEKLFLSFSLMQLLLMILVMNHLVACAWFGIGRLTKDVDLFRSNGGKNWLQDAGMTPVMDRYGFETTLSWQYLTALHWSITQFTPASMDISATNELERIFSIMILFWALLALSSIIGSVTASMTALRNISTEENKHFWTLRRYLRQNLSSKEEDHRDFITRCLRFLEARSQKTQNVVPESKVVLLSHLSDSFRYKLANFVTSKYVRTHPFFNCLMGDDFMWRLCFIAMKSACYAEDDIVFHAGDEGLHMYFMKSGHVEYKLAGLEEGVKLHHSKAWISEGALWTDWRHKGTLQALTDNCELLNVKPSSFITELRLNPRTWYLGQRYGLKFVDNLNRLLRKPNAALTDFVFERARWDHWIEAIGAKQNGGTHTPDKTHFLADASRCATKDIGQDIGDMFQSEQLGNSQSEEQDLRTQQSTRTTTTQVMEL
eukprot:CAMPEP_0178428472 /NCGR_PEP_ID=MMETSP0689_2-20121128/30296_1 /TAXON_ID=160604 /ORGANISM="Amphidinium massartii, Strain CS-259" /LENGTH=841 /DNA_ID=CAMNT_0020050247 /DNA_START=85 /DNA_END=2610 /DNA_ORIENTATION=+